MKVKIFEVGPRDGLQNEKTLISVDDRVEFTARLVQSGIKFIEAAAFVRDDKVPQMAQSSEFFKKLQTRLGKQTSSIHLSALVPNMKGLEQALECGVKEIAVFTAASESFNKANINASIQESIERFKPVVAEAKKRKLFVRGYVSTAFGCPYEGEIKPKKVLEVTNTLLKLGIQEISIGDTIGVADPKQVKKLTRSLLKLVGAKKLALHFHDTRGTALANCVAGLEEGVRIFDSSAGGLGGCPYAPGASGNMATEDLVYCFEHMGIETGIDLKKLVAASQFIESRIGRDLVSKAYRAVLSNGQFT